MVHAGIHEDSVLAGFLQEIRRRLGPRVRKIILFGSRARGEATADSDYDCLIVVDAVDRQVTDCIDEVAGGILYRFSRMISAFPIRESVMHSRRYSPLLQNVRAEGVPV